MDSVGSCWKPLPVALGVGLGEHHVRIEVTNRLGYRLKAGLGFAEVEVDVILGDLDAVRRRVAGYFQMEDRSRGDDDEPARVC